MTRCVLVTDYAWDSLDVERGLLAAAGADLLVAARGDEAELVALAPRADAILTNWRHVTAAVLDAAERCAVVARYGVGLDNIDVERADALGMVVTNVPDFCIDEVAEHALALVLALRRNVVRFARQTAGGGWDHAAFGPLYRVAGQTLGVVGAGRLGQATAQRARALGMEVLMHSRSQGVSLEELLERSDVVSLHVPLDDSTRGLIGAAELALMKPTAVLVNTSRGAVVDQAALAAALVAGTIAGAALDVLEGEPPDPGDPLLALENVIVTPHAAAFSIESTRAVQERAATSVADVLGGRAPRDVVNPGVLGSDRLRARLA